MNKFIFALALTVALVAACDTKTQAPVVGTSSSNGSSKVTKASEVKVDLTTPDRALKSYWSVRDDIREKERAYWKEILPRYLSIGSSIEKVATGPIAKDFQSVNTEVETFARDIQDIKVETESRAIVIAVIKNTTPIPAGAELSKFDEERRRDGEKYRYVLEKDQGGWRVAEIWSWSTFPKQDWDKSRPTDGKPRVSSFTYEGI